MEVLVRNAEGNLSQKDREYAAKKLGRLDRFFNQAHKVELVHKEEKLGHRIEVTVFADGFTIRGEDTEASVHAAIDKVSDRLDSRLRKLKGRLVTNHRKKGLTRLPPALAEVSDHEVPQEDYTSNGHLVRKSFVLKPMSVDEAMLQLEFVDHPFFVFKNVDSGQVEVLYRRRGDGYGLLEPAE